MRIQRRVPLNAKKKGWSGVMWEKAVEAFPGATPRTPRQEIRTTQKQFAPRKTFAPSEGSKKNFSKKIRKGEARDFRPGR